MNNLSIEDTREQTITLPSGHYLSFKLVPMELSNQVELIIGDTNIAQYNYWKNIGKAIWLQRPEDSIVLEGTRVTFS